MKDRFVIKNISLLLFVVVIFLAILTVSGCANGKSHIIHTEIKYDTYKYVALAEVVYDGEIARVDEVENMIEIELDTWFFTSGIPNNLLRVKYEDEDENVVFECLTNEGSFWWNNEYTKKVVAKPNEELSWQCPINGPDSNENIYIDIILKRENNIIGYAVIEINQIEGYDYSAQVIKTGVFPRVNENYQDITEQYVSDVIANAKNK